jgi:hypothetical protein
MFKKFKLWLYLKLHAWYLASYVPEHVQSNTNLLLRQQLKAKIISDFGVKCKNLNLNCASCQAHLALDILQDLYFEFGNAPAHFNEGLQHMPSEQTSQNVNSHLCACGHWPADHGVNGTCKVPDCKKLCANT